MRKFSKKIAMMMVLAMLVSMFSGIVSASAASIWSAKSVDDDNYAVVMGETIEVKKGEFINFDLFKGDEEATEAGYEYTWESSDADVLFINGAQGAKNGYARVKGEVGEKATISVSFTNLKTGVTVKTPRTFDVVVVEELEADVEVEEAEYSIVTKIGDAVLGAEVLEAGKEYALTSTVTAIADGKAVEAVVTYAIDDKAVEKLNLKAGEYTVVATATVDDEVIATEEYDVVVLYLDEFEVKQISAKAFTMTFAEEKDLSKLTKEDIYVGSAATVDGALYKEYVGSIKVEKNVVTVNLYNEMAKDTYITVKFADETAGFKVSKGDVDQVVVVDGPVMIGEARKLNIKLFSAGIEVTNDTLLSNVTVEIVSGGENANVVNGNQIIFWEAGKTAVVKATYHTYDFATNGNGTERVYVSAPASITSRDTAVSLGNITEWTLTNQANWWDIKWNGKNFIALDDNNGSYRVVGKLVQTTTTTYDAPVTKRTDELGDRLAYESSNTDVLYVDSTGKLYPIKQGVSDIIVKDTKNNNAIIGVYTVTVKAEKQLVSITATLATKNLISENESVVIAVAGKDQYGEDFNINHNGGVSFTNVADNSIPLTFAYQYWGGRYELKNAGDLDTANGKTYTCEVKVGDKKAYVSFTVKSADTNASLYKYGFDADSHTFSTNVTDQTEKYSQAIKIATYDKNGLLAQATGTVPIKGILANANQTTANATVTGGAYYVVVDKPSYVGNIGEIVTLNDGVISFNYLMEKEGGAVLDKAAAGSYTLKLYKANVIEGDKIGFTLIDTLPITVKDDQTQFVASVKATKADVDFALISNAVSGKTVDATIISILDTCYDLKLGNDTYKFADLTYTNGSMSAIAVDPNLSIKEVKVLKTIKVKKGVDGTAEQQYKVLMTINLYNQSITLK